MNYKKIIATAAAILLIAGCNKGGSNKTYPRFGEGDNEITGFTFTAQKNSILGADVEGTITDDTILITVPNGTIVKSLVAIYITDSTDVRVNGIAQVNGETPNDFSSDVIYTVTAGDSVKTYTVRVLIAPSSEKKITTFLLNGTPGDIDQETGIITVSLAPKTSLTSLIASFTSVCKKITIGDTEQVSGETVNDFTGDVIYTVTAQDGSTAQYTVRAAARKASWKEITEFGFYKADNGDKLTGDSAVSGPDQDNVISAILPYGSTTSNLVAVFKTTGDSVLVNDRPQESGKTENSFSSPVEYRVVAEDGSSSIYTVNVAVAKNSAKVMQSFILDGEDGVIDEEKGSITVEFPQIKNITALKASFETTGSNVTVNGNEQTSGVTVNDFSTGPVYRVIAEDGSYRDYTVSVIKNTDITGIWNFDGTGSDYTLFEAVTVPGISGNALQFDGYNDYVIIPDDPALTLAKAGTIEVAIKVISHKNSAGIVHKGEKSDFSDETFSLQYYSTTGNLSFLVTNTRNNMSWIDSPTTLQLNRWYYIVATWDITAGKLRIYINGSLDCEGNIAPVDVRDSNGGLVIGAQLPVQYSPKLGNLGFNGLIDRVQLSSRALTADEISARYAAFTEEVSGITAFILRATPANRPLILTLLLVITALIGGLWARNRIKKQKWGKAQ